MKMAGILFCLAGFIAVPLFSQDAREIVKKADEHERGATSVATLTIQTIRPNWSREMTVKSWTKGNDLVMIQVTSPAKDKGIVYLKRKREVWNWIPAIERSIKLPPSMMSQNWMGTDFTNDDLVQEASIVTDYDHSIAGDSTIDGRNCYKIRLQPRQGAPVVWGRIFLWIDKKDPLMLRAEYFDEENILINTLVASDIKMLGGRLLPSRMEMLPADKKTQKTVLIYTALEFDKPLDDNFFTIQNMSRLQ